jgi:DNA (cytosine-5)-methyltransferase 1
VRPLALDLFCGVGGASVGLHRAGFDVTGVDIRPQKNYPFRFVQADALNPPFDLRSFDFIWASPPCQAHTSLKTMWNARKHADLIPQTRTLLVEAGVPWVIENVPGASSLRPIVRLCGTSFGLATVSGPIKAELRRHRYFESSFAMLAPPCDHGGTVIGVYGGHGRNRKRVPTIGVYGGGHGVSTHRREKGERSFTAAEQREAMGMAWATVDELSQAIPPAYGEFIGRAALTEGAPPWSTAPDPDLTPPAFLDRRKAKETAAE